MHKLRALGVSIVAAVAGCSQAAPEDASQGRTESNLYVDNPGPLTLTIVPNDPVRASYRIGTLPPFPFLEPSTLSGTVDSEGNVSVPANDVRIKESTINVAVGPFPLTVTFGLEAVEDATGRLNPLSGRASLRFVLNATIASSSPLLPPGCKIGPAEVRFESGTIADGSIVHMISSGFVVPRATEAACGALASTINAQIGLDGVSTNNRVEITATLDRPLSGSVPPSLVGVHRANGEEHFYSTDYAEVIASGMQPEERYAFFLRQKADDGLVALNRCYDAGRHLLTTDGRCEVMQRDPEGVLGFVAVEQIPGTVPLFRAYNASSRDHFYTTNRQELDYAIANLGYSGEGVAGHVWTSP